MMHSRLLYHFSVIADEGTLSAAAKVIGVTQPALTRSVKQLEDIIGASLLDRRPNGVVLTDEGRILARRVKLMSLNTSTPWRKFPIERRVSGGVCGSPADRPGSCPSCLRRSSNFRSNIPRLPSP